MNTLSNVLFHFITATRFGFFPLRLNCERVMLSDVLFTSPSPFSAHLPNHPPLFFSPSSFVNGAIEGSGTAIDYPLLIIKIVLPLLPILCSSSLLLSQPNPHPFLFFSFTRSTAPPLAHLYPSLPPSNFHRIQNQKKT